MDTSRELLFSEYKMLSAIFDECDYAHPDDMQLFESGNHRHMYNYLCSVGVYVTPGRGPVYHAAAELLKENREYRKQAIVDALSGIAMHNNLAAWAALFMGSE